MKRILLLTVTAVIAFCSTQLLAQDMLGGRISGNFQLEGQTYNKDTLVGVPDVDEKIRSNSFLNLMYSTSNFEVGLRYEAYLGPMLGFDSRFDGSGIANRYARYHNDFIDVTAGNFYEQFGSGMILRAYQEWTLGNDNSIDGMRVKLTPIEGISLTGLIGKQRFFWEQYDGMVRGFDVNLNWNTLFDKDATGYNLDFGGSFVSKFQKDKDPFLNLPQNVGAYSFRTNLATDNFSLAGEWAHKINDPNIANKNIYNDGNGIILSASYFGMKGLSAAINYHWIDNMDYRLDRTVTGQAPALNYIPPLAKNQSYRLATAYPYGTQMNGESGIQAEITYLIPKKSTLGGKYGTTIALNYSRMTNIDSSMVNKYEYESKFMGTGDELLYQDINLDITRKFNKKYKMNLSFIHQQYNKDYCEFAGAEHYGMVTSNILIYNGTHKVAKKQAVRLELQHSWTTQEVEELHEPDNLNGNWIMGLVEYTFAPNFFFSVSDEYNYGNQWDGDYGNKEDRRLHYYNISAGWIHESTRVQFGYGRQRDGILCVGGVCRYVPATDGLYVSVSSSF